MEVFAHTRRTNPSPATHSEGTFQFLNRVSGQYWDQVRALINSWHSRLDVEAQADVRGRLRSKDDRQHRGALLELYVHECLLRMGYSITCHPKVEGTKSRPDFLAEKNGRAIYVEARASSSSDDSVGRSARLRAIYDSLDVIKSPNFFLWIEVLQQGGTPFSAKPLRRRLERWLASLDPNLHLASHDKRASDFPHYLFEDADWKISFRAIAKSSETRGKAGVRPLGIFGGGEAHWIEDEESIKSALADKGSTYGSLGAPFIVVVGSDSVSQKDDAVIDALYGSEVVEFRTDFDGTESHVRTRRPNGYWFKGDHWDHRGVSAVLVVRNLHAAFVGSQCHTIWEHPDPEFPVDQFAIWRRSFIENDQMSFVDPNRPQYEWFALDPSWPVGEAFPN